MSVAIQQRIEQLTIRFTTDLNFETSHTVQADLAVITTDEQVKTIILDFSQVHFIDSTGVSLLIKWIYPYTRKATVEVHNASQPVKNILRICKLEQFVKIF